MDEATAIIALGIAFMLPAIWEVWCLLKVGYMMRGSPPVSGKDLNRIIEDLREDMNALHTDLETWRDYGTDRNLKVKDLEAEQVSLDLEIMNLKDEVLHQKGRAASAHTTRGQLLEKWTPFVSAEGIDEHWRPEDWVFLGQPIDYMVFDWRADKVENLTTGNIVLLDVKSGKSQLSSKQRRIRDLIKAGKVEWREVRLD